VAVYLGSGYHTAREMLRHGIAAVVVIGLLAFAAYDMRHIGFDRLGITPSKPAVGLDIYQPRVTV
jgi:hypothetical protein